MMSVLAIVVVIVLNLIPTEMTSFRVQLGPNDTIHFKKRPDGGWDAERSPQKPIGAFYVDGTSLTIKGESKELTQDLAKIIGAGKNPDWADLKLVQIEDVPLHIEHTANGLDFVVKPPAGDDQPERRIKVQWSKADSE
jgi:hypothetical protein